MHKSFLIYLPSVLLPRLSSFVLILVGSHYLPADQFGYYSLIVIIGEFAEMTFTNWTRISLTRFGSGMSMLPYDLVKRTISITAACSSFSILVSAAVIFAIASENFATVFACVAAYIASISVLRLGISLNQSQNNKVAASSIESIRAALTLAAGTALMVVCHDFLYASLCGSLLNILFGVLSVRIGTARTSKDGTDTVDLKTLLKFAYPLILLAMFSYMITSLDKAMLKTYYDTTALGHYSAAFTFARSGFDIIATAFNIGGFVQVSTLSNQGRHDEVPRFLSRQMAHITAIALPAAGLFIGSRQVLASTFFPPGYYETFVAATPIIAFGAIALNVKNFVYDNAFYIKLKNVLQIPPLAVGAATSAILGVILLRNHPQIGPAIMFTAGSVTSLVATAFISRRLVAIPLPVSQLAVSTSLGLIGWLATDRLQAGLTGASNYLILALQGAIGAVIILTSARFTAKTAKSKTNMPSLGDGSPAK
jgi:O-antigen/teichoic acid export membrane protein